MVALLFNLSGTEKKHKKTQVVAHTHVQARSSARCASATCVIANAMQLIVDRMNRAGGATNRWVIVAMHGVFESWRTCVAYLHEWDAGVRGPGRRLEHGVRQFLQYTLPLQLSMWVERRPRDEVLAGWDEDRQRRVSTAQPVPLHDAASNAIVLLDELEEVFCGSGDMMVVDDHKRARPHGGGRDNVTIATMKRLCLHKEKKKPQIQQHQAVKS